MQILIAKYALTAFIIVLVSEVAKRSDKIGALISSLPFVTIMVMIWIFLDTGDTNKVSSHAFYTFWYVLPTMPMFLVMPWLITKGWNFWLSLLLCAIITIISFTITAIITRQFGIDLIP